jgi:release factor glutamine methyltransferase
MRLQILHSHAATIGEVLHQAAATLASTSPTPRLDAEVLLMHVCGLDRGGLIIHGRDACTDDQRHLLEQLLARRRQGEPVAYLTGWREFWSMPLAVSPATLIPRPETELLVEKALAHIPHDAAWTLADLGTGSGAIALALAMERPRCRVLATDISRHALDVARSNAAKFNLTHVEFREGRWLEPLAGMRLDMIVSNPPYVRDDDPHLQCGDVRFEPRPALIAGADGLDAIRHIVKASGAHLKAGGWLLLEHGHDQAAVATLLQQHGYETIHCHADLSGRDRVSEARWP